MQHAGDLWRRHADRGASANSPPQPGPVHRRPTSGELIPLLQIAPSKTDTERLLVDQPRAGRRPRHDHPPDPRTRRGGAAGRRLRLARARLEPTDAAAVPTPDSASDNRSIPPARSARWTAEPPRRRAPATGRMTHGRTAAELHSARFPADLHHRRHHARNAAAHRPARRRPPRHQHHDGLQGGLPRGGHQRPPGIHRPAAGAAPSGGVPDAHRRRMGGVPRPFERRKVALGACGRSYATACIHEHACLTEMILKGSARPEGFIAHGR